jgi:hypothetical protein
MRSAPLVLFALVVACGQSGPSFTSGTGVLAPAKIYANIFVVDASLNGAPGGQVILDTGSPLTLLDAHGFDGAPINSGHYTADLTVAGAGVSGVTVIPLIAGGGLVDGIVGGDVFHTSTLALAYRDKQVRFGDGPSPDGIDASATPVAFSLEGGGEGRINNEVISYPATRVIVNLSIDGEDHVVMLDSGASATTLRTSVFDHMIADGRPRIDDGPTVSTLTGPAQTRLTRARKLAIGGFELANSLVSTIGDDLFNNIGQEVGHNLDGVVGGTYLREFFVTIDYSNHQLRLQRWNDGSHIPDEMVRVGIELGAGPPYSVATVYSGSDAQKQGIRIGDELRAIDGTDLSSKDPAFISSALAGKVGESHTLTMGATTDTTINGKSVEVRVEDLLPVP